MKKQNPKLLKKTTRKKSHLFRFTKIYFNFCGPSTRLHLRSSGAGVFRLHTEERPQRREQHTRERPKRPKARTPHRGKTTKAKTVHQARLSWTSIEISSVETFKDFLRIQHQSLFLPKKNRSIAQANIVIFYWFTWSACNISGHCYIQQQHLAIAAQFHLKHIIFKGCFSAMPWNSAPHLIIKN